MFEVLRSIFEVVNLYSEIVVKLNVNDWNVKGKWLCDVLEKVVEVGLLGFYVFVEFGG